MSPKDFQHERSCAACIHWRPATFTRSSVHLVGVGLKEAWKETRWPAEVRVVHSHRKRHNIDPPPPPPDADAKKRNSAVNKLRESRKKPSGHLTPLDEDDMDNDEVVSVAVGPPPMRPKYDKLSWKPRTKPERTHLPTPAEQPNVNPAATNLVKEVLVQLGREFLTHQVNEDFVFGQYVGNAMRGLPSDSKLKMQHEILELVVKYQKTNRTSTSPDHHIFKKNDEIKLSRDRKGLNDTDDVWPDFTNLAKIVG